MQLILIFLPPLQGDKTKCVYGDGGGGIVQSWQNIDTVAIEFITG